MSAESDLAAGLSPEQLVPGDIPGLRAAAANAGALADQLASTARGLAYIELYGDHWTGLAADAYEAARDRDIGIFKRAARAFDEAAEALETYARTLGEARRLARSAREAYHRGRQRQAQDEAACAVPPTTPGVLFQDPYGIAGAVTTLTEARDDVRRAAAVAASKLRDAAAVAPRQSSLVRPRKDFDPSPLTRPIVGLATAPWRLARGAAVGLGDSLIGSAYTGTPYAGHYADRAERGWSQENAAALTMLSLLPLGRGEAVLGRLAGGLGPAQREAADGALGASASTAAKAPASIDDVWRQLPKGDQERTVRLVESRSQLEAIYSMLARGGQVVHAPRYNGVMVQRGDGIRVGLRQESKSGGYTIDIQRPNEPLRKIHIR